MNEWRECPRDRWRETNCSLNRPRKDSAPFESDGEEEKLEESIGSPRNGVRVESRKVRDDDDSILPASSATVR